MLRGNRRGLADRELRRGDSLTGPEVIGRKLGDYAGLLIPYFHPETNQVREYRLRRDDPDLEYDLAGHFKVKQKYLSVPGRSNMLYLPPAVSHSLLRDPALPVDSSRPRLSEARRHEFRFGCRANPLSPGGTRSRIIPSRARLWPEVNRHWPTRVVDVGNLRRRLADREERLRRQYRRSAEFQGAIKSRNSLGMVTCPWFPCLSRGFHSTHSGLGSAFRALCGRRELPSKCF